MAFLRHNGPNASMSRSSLFNPFALWTDLALQTGSMMLASADVISHRTQRMAQASLPLSARDQAEFTLMGQEKVEAAMEAMQAAGMQMLTLNPLAGPKLWQDMLAVQSGLLSLAASASLPVVLARNAALGRSLRKAHTSARNLSDHTATTALKALQPIRTRAMANARRLKKKT